MSTKIDTEMLGKKSDIICVCGEHLYYMKTCETYNGTSTSVWCDICSNTVNNNGYVYHCKKAYSSYHDSGYDVCQSCVNTLPRKNLSIPLEYVCNVCGNIKRKHDISKCVILVAGYMRQYSYIVISDIVLFIHDLLDVIYVPIKYEILSKWKELMIYNVNYNKKLNGLKEINENEGRIVLRIDSNAKYSDILDEISKYYGINKDYIDFKISKKDKDKNNDTRVDVNACIKHELINRNECYWEYLGCKYELIYNMDIHYKNRNSNFNVIESMYDSQAIFRCKIFYKNASEYDQNIPEITLAFKKDFIIKEFIENVLNVLKNDTYCGSIIQSIKANDYDKTLINHNNTEIRNIINNWKYNEFTLYLEYIETNPLKYDEPFAYPNAYNPMLKTVLRLQYNPYQDDSKDNNSEKNLIIEYYRNDITTKSYYRCNCDMFTVDANRCRLIDFMLNDFLKYNKQINKGSLLNEYKTYIKTRIHHGRNALSDMGKEINLKDTTYNIPIKIFLKRFPEFHIRIVLD